MISPGKLKSASANSDHFERLPEAFIAVDCLKWLETHWIKYNKGEEIRKTDSNKKSFKWILLQV